MAALCDLGDPGWGSLVSALSFVPSYTLQVAHCDFAVGPAVVYFYGLRT